MQAALHGGACHALNTARADQLMWILTCAGCCPQVSIVDGQIVVDRATLTVQAQAEDTQRAIVEDTQQLNSRSYAVNRTPSDRWQPQETENFYRVGACMCSGCLHPCESKAIAKS
jgi:hypothetical protein